MPQKLKKIYYVDFGCRLNQFETRVLENTAGDKSATAKSADVIVINTCTVTGRADMKNRQAIRKARAENPQAEIIVTGCYASTESDINAIKEMDDNITVVPNKLKFSIPDIIAKKQTSETPTLFPPARQIKETSARAYLKVQDGCNKKCSYCKIPVARGAAVSRDFNNTVEEVHNLIDAGFHEIILTGVNVGHFKSEGKNLKDLFRTLGQIKGNHFYRLSSIEPECIDEELLEIMITGGFAEFLHVPLQSGSNRILKLMRRGYDFEKFASTISLIRKQMPLAHIGTDIMAGFPGESEDDFQCSLDAVRNLQFANVHVFPFSKRPGSEIDNKVRARTPGVEEVNGKIIKERVKKIIALQEDNHRNFILNTSGKTYRGIIENVFSDHLEIVTENYVRGKIYLNTTGFQKGEMINVSYSPDLIFTIED